MEFIFETNIKPNIDNFVKLDDFEKNILKKTKNITNSNKYYRTINDGINDLFSNNIGYPEEIVENYRIGWKSQYQNYHKGYLWYLYTAYMSDAGIEIAPWYLYNVILHQIAQVVKDNSEEFRNIFTSSNEKIIIQMNTYEFDINTYHQIIKNLIPNQTAFETFFPTWTNPPEYYNECIQGLFADMVQKYYSVMIIGCSCPKIRVKGTQVDWDKLHKTIVDLKNIFNLNNTHILDDYLNKVISCTENFKLNWNKKETWENFFFITNCGSGHQEGIGGTIRQLLNYSLYKEMLVSQLPSTLSRFPFEMSVEGMEKQKDSYFISGLVGSNIDSDGYLVPSYDYAITWINHEATKLDENKINELLWIRDELEKWERVSIGGKNIKHHFIHDSPQYSNSRSWTNYLNKKDLEILNKVKIDDIDGINSANIINEYLLKEYETLKRRYNFRKEMDDPYNPAGEEPTLDEVTNSFEKRKQNGTVDKALKLIEKERLEKLENKNLPYSHLWFEGINSITPSNYSWNTNKNACLNLEQYLKQLEKVELYIIQLQDPEYLVKIINRIQNLNTVFGINKMNSGYVDGIDIIIGTLNSNVIKLFCKLFESKSNYVIDLLLYYLTDYHIFITNFDNNVFPSHFTLSSDLKKYLQEKFFIELKELFENRICFYIDNDNDIDIDGKNKYLIELKNKLKTKTFV
jgi:hypothetical protein